MHANERGRVQGERARTHALMSVWVRACKRRGGCRHASTSVVACMQAAQARAWVRARKRKHRLCMQAQVWVCACEHGRGCMHVSGEHANGQTDMQAGE